MDTRMKLLLAAERLYALHGPDGASARMIVAEAGQRNASALNYHFETREALVEAICRLRMEPINTERVAQVKAYLADRPEPAERLRALIGIMCHPGRIPIYEAEGKSYFRRFLAQAINNPSTNFYEIVRGRFDTGLRQLAPLMREEIPHLPRQIADKRIATIMRTSSYLSAHHEARCAEGPWPVRKAELELETELMIDGLVGFLRGPNTVSIPTKSSKATSQKETSEPVWETALS
jgi:AcrR family transcriptional regulator